MIQALILTAALGAQPAATAEIPAGVPVGVEIYADQEAAKIRGQNYPVNTGGGAVAIRCESFSVRFKTQTFRGHNCVTVKPDTRRF